MTNADYTDDQTLPTNTSATEESQLHILEQSAEVIANETEYTCFKQKELYPLYGKT